MSRNTFLYTAYAGGTTFPLKNLGSIKKLLNTLSLFSSSSDLKPKLYKCEVVGIGKLKEGKVAIFGINCTDCTKDAINILRIFFRVVKILN